MTQQPEPNEPNCISDHYILASPTQTLGEVKAAYEKKLGRLDWILLIDQPGAALLGCTFREIFPWIANSRSSKMNLETLIKDEASPLRPVTRVEVGSPEHRKLLKAKSTKEGLVAITLLGEVGGVWLEALPGKKEPPAKPRSLLTTVDQVGETRYKQFKRFQEWWPVALASFIFGLVITFITLKTINFSEVFPSLLPPKMTGEWNVLVTGFTPTGKPAISPAEARYISEVFYNHFQTELDALGNELGVSVQLLGPGKTARITGDTVEEREDRAANLAGKTKADIVIYGTIQKTDNSYSLAPEFYINVRNFPDAKEIVGQYTLGKAIDIFAIEENLPAQIVLNKELSRRSKILALISQGLGMYLTHRYEDALDLFTTANDAELWPYEEGREVVYLFEGNAAGKAGLYERSMQAFEESLAINPEYARAYVGLGSDYYQFSLVDSSRDNFQPDQESLKQALDAYDAALAAKYQPLSADIATKVAMGKGQVYLVMGLSGEDTFEQAREQFNRVIADFEQNGNQRVQEQASEAYAFTGLMALRQGNLDEAIENYQAAIQYATSPERKAIHWFAVGDIHQDQGNPSEAKNAYRSAIDEYQTALSLTNQPARQAGYWTRIADCYQKLGQPQQARAALEEAIKKLPLASAERQALEEQLGENNP